MKRAVLAVCSLAATLLVPLFVLAQPASAHCVPDGNYTIYVTSNKTFLYAPTNVYSIWSQFPYGGSITYNRTKTAEQNASTTGTVTAEASGVFASASASVGHTVGKSFSRSTSWSYTANVKADRTHKYRVHLYHWAVTFTSTKKQFDVAGCTYRTVKGWPQRIHHAPAGKSRGALIWKVDRAAA